MLGPRSLLPTVLLLTQLIPAGCVVVFDCTRVINDLLQNQSALPSDLAVLRKALNESKTIYYESEEEVEMFPNTFSRMTELLQSLGWKVGHHDEGGKPNSLWLAFGGERNRKFIETENNQPPTKFNFTHVSLEPQSAPILIIFTWHKDKNACSSDEINCNDALKNVRNILNNPQKLEGATPIVGMGYSETQIGCKFSPYSNLINLKDIMFLLSIEFTAGTRFPESYYLFNDFVNSVVDKNAFHLKRFNIRYTLILNFKLSRQNAALESRPEINAAYITLLAQYSRRWASEHGHSVVIEMCDETVSNYKWTTIPPDVKDTVISPFSRIPRFCDPNFDFQKIYALAASAFATVLTSPYGWSSCKRYIKKFENLDKNLLTNDGTLKLMVRVTEKENSADFGNMLKYQKAYFNSQHITFLLDSSSFSFMPLIKSLNVSTAIGCTVKIFSTSEVRPGRISGIVEQIEKACPFQSFPEISIVELNIYKQLDVDGASKLISENTLTPSFYLTLVQPKLFTLFEAFLQIQKKHPSTRMILGIEGVFQQAHANYEFAPELYCNDKIQRLNQLTEAIITWSYMHNISVILLELINTYPASLHGWWDRINVLSIPRDAICPTQCNTMYLLRNYPDTMHYFDNQPCLTRHQELPRKKIQIHFERMGCRIYLQVAGRRDDESLTPGELQTQLQFVLHSFSRIEIICDDDSQLDLLPSTLEPVLSSSPNNNETEIIINIRLDQQAFHEVQVPKVQMLAQELVSRNPNANFGIQIMICCWENQPENNATRGLLLVQGFQKIIQSCKGLNVAIGLVIDSCEKVISVVEGAWQVALYRLEFSHFLCNENLSPGDTYDRYNPNNYFKTMSKFLDKSFATKVTLEREFPGKHIVTRIRIINAPNEENYLRTIRDINQHAELYNMTYFAINVIHSPSESGWWKVANNSDMSNPSGYTGTENEFLGVPTWRPPEIIYKSSPARETNQVYWIIGVFGILLVAVFVAALLIGWAVSRKRYLTREEEAEFLEGNSAGAGGSDYLNMKFDEKFKISKVDLSSGSNAILGMGNFGTVFKARVRGSWVAVKVPLEGGSKQAFLSTLQEIKILCHVGSHPNVVGFVGAYIAEIRSGIVQIATELCENGALLKYLRGISASITGTHLALSCHGPEVATTFDLARLCMEIAAGMDHLANKKVIHGDLAARNILLDEHNACKIGDFGLSRKLYEYEKYVKQSSEPLPWRWLAYESLDRMEFSSKSDVWSYGVTLWEIYSLGGVPYPGINWTADFVQSLESGLRLQKPKFSTDEIFAKMSECWNVEIEKRPSFAELCQYFQDILGSQYTNLE